VHLNSTTQKIHAGGEEFSVIGIEDSVFVRIADRWERCG